MIRNIFWGNRKIKYISAGPPTRVYCKSGAEKKSATCRIRTTDHIRDPCNTCNKGVFSLYVYICISGLSPLLLQATLDMVLQALFNVELGAQKKLTEVNATLKPCNSKKPTVGGL